MANEELETYLRTHRRKCGFSQDDLAYLVGSLCGTMVSRHERGHRLPMLETALLYELVLGCPMHDLFEGVVIRLHKEVYKRARGFVRNLERRPATTVRDQKLAALRRIISEVEERIAA